MSIVTITLNNKNFQLACNEGEEAQLITLASNLNNKMLEMKIASPTASHELLLVMTALSIQDQLESLTTKLGKIKGDNDINEGEKFAETLSTIAQYLENLAKKISR